MDILLRIKNWQLFLIIFLLPWLLLIAYITIFESNSSTYNVFAAIFTLIYYVIFVGWNYKVIKTFNKTEKILTEKQNKRLDWLLIIFFIYLIFILFRTQVFETDLLVFRILSPILMLLSVYSFIFLVYCTAKTLKYLQLKNQIRTADIIVEMFIIFYFIIGVWWLQRKVNKYYDEYIRH